MKPGNIATLPQEIQKHVDAFASWLVDMEKGEYHNDLVPFAQRAEEIRTKTVEAACQLRHQFKQAEKILHEKFVLEEKEKNLPKEALFENWEKAASKIGQKIKNPKFSLGKMEMKQSIQELLGLEWAFMDRAYHIGCQLLHDKRYEEAESVYFFLRFLNPMVFEYWLGMGTAEQAQNKLENAVNTYSMSLALDPENPLIFFQIANCYYQVDEFASCLQALDYCIDFIANAPQHAELLKAAILLKQKAEKQKMERK